ncbi:MAG: sugar ABC transporter permease [Lachnospiraceae bacterium]|nr:sugar ABC transporter permease [Lachnospiraceae bacterium]
MYKFKSKATPYFFLLPCAALIFTILIYPVTAGMINSFYDENLLMPMEPTFIGISNYQSLLGNPMFLGALWRSIIWTITIQVFSLTIGLFFALALNGNIFWKKLLRCLVLIPWVIPNAISGIIWRWFLDGSYGLLNYILRSLGIIQHNLQWLSTEHLAASALVSVIIWRSIPFITITLLAGLQAIPMDIYEAAQVDGASRLRILMHMTLPLLSKIIIITTILTSIWNFNQFEIIQVITRGGPGEATLTLPVFIYRLFMQTFQTSIASSAAVIMMIILTIPTIVYVRKILRG